MPLMAAPLQLHAARKDSAIVAAAELRRHVKDIQRADFEYLRSQVSAGCTPKVTIPSPTMLHYRGARAGISARAYPELDPEFYDDVAAAYFLEYDDTR